MSPGGRWCRSKEGGWMGGSFWVIGMGVAAYGVDLSSWEF